MHQRWLPKARFIHVNVVLCIDKIIPSAKKIKATGCGHSHRYVPPSEPSIVSPHTYRTEGGNSDKARTDMDGFGSICQTVSYYGNEMFFIFGRSPFANGLYPNIKKKTSRYHSNYQTVIRDETFRGQW